MLIFTIVTLGWIASIWGEAEAAQIEAKMEWSRKGFVSAFLPQSYCPLFNICSLDAKTTNGRPSMDLEGESTEADWTKLQAGPTLCYREKLTNRFGLRRAIVPPFPPVAHLSGSRNHLLTEKPTHTP